MQWSVFLSEYFSYCYCYMLLIFVYKHVWCKLAFGLWCYYDINTIIIIINLSCCYTAKLVFVQSNYFYFFISSLPFHSISSPSGGGHPKLFFGGYVLHRFSKEGATEQSFFKKLGSWEWNFAKISVWRCYFAKISENAWKCRIFWKMENVRHKNWH